MLEKLKEIFTRKKRVSITTPIMIIDDDEATRLYLKKILTNADFKVVEAEDAYAASEVFSREEVDLVITDILMPGKSGLDLIIDMCRAKKDLHVIAISGAQTRGTISNLSAAELLGAQLTLAKPFTKKELLEGIEKVLN